MQFSVHPNKEDTNKSETKHCNYTNTHTALYERKAQVRNYVT